MICVNCNKGNFQSVEALIKHRRTVKCDKLEARDRLQHRGAHGNSLASIFNLPGVKQ